MQTRIKELESEIVRHKLEANQCMEENNLFRHAIRDASDVIIETESYLIQSGHAASPMVHKLPIASQHLQALATRPRAGSTDSMYGVGSPAVRAKIAAVSAFQQGSPSMRSLGSHDDGSAIGSPLPVAVATTSPMNVYSPNHATTSTTAITATTAVVPVPHIIPTELPVQPRDLPPAPAVPAIDPHANASSSSAVAGGAVSALDREFMALTQELDNIASPRDPGAGVQG
eukprot:GFYU01012840.1.p1 GENE.GFYU01012840.1~~GFYU01012840.1.p1  ORF type:complete len:257 (+),score=40.58 GFYU01012840.1:87-773(+)